MADAKDETTAERMAKTKEQWVQERDEALVEVDRLTSEATRLAEERETLRRERDAAVARSGAHLGDPCRFCGQRHDQVDVGPCLATREALAAQRDALLAALEKAVRAMAAVRPEKECMICDGTEGNVCPACMELSRIEGEMAGPLSAARTALAQAKGGG